MKFIEGARNWGSILGTPAFVWSLTPPPTQTGTGHGRHEAVAWGGGGGCHNG